MWRRAALRHAAPLEKERRQSRPVEEHAIPNSWQAAAASAGWHLYLALRLMRGSAAAVTLRRCHCLSSFIIENNVIIINQ